MNAATTTRRPYKPNCFTSEDVRAFWDSVADEYVHEGESIKATHFQRFERAFAYFDPHNGTSALNIWSRNGEAIDYFRRHAPHMQLVNAEVSPRLIEKSQQKHPDEEFVETDLMDLSFDDGRFDLVLSLETLEHTPDPLRFLRELYRVLKPGGKLVMSCPPATAEPMLRIYELFFRNHGEGPHRFLPSREVKTLLHNVGFELKIHDSTLFIPAGPRFLRRLEPWIERLLRRTPLGELGIRQFFVAGKPIGAGPWVVNTPNFDRVANDGVLFTYAFAAAARCTPSRAAILTGQHVWRLKEAANLMGPLRAEFEFYPDSRPGFHGHRRERLVSSGRRGLSLAGDSDARVPLHPQLQARPLAGRRPARRRSAARPFR